MMPFIDILATYQVPAAFAGAFFFGETVVMTAAYLAAQLDWSIPPLFLAALLGTLAADSAWYYGGTRLAGWMQARPRWQTYQEKHAAEITATKRLVGEKPFRALLYIKFLYGTRILMILYLSWREVSWKKFLLYDAIGTTAWLVVIMGIGYLAGRGIANLIPAVQTTGFILLGLAIVIIGSRLFSIWITKRITKEE